MTGLGTGPWVRRGLLVTILAMGSALLVTSWLGYSRAVDASATVSRGQGEALLTSARQQLERQAGPPTPALMRSLIEQHEAVGLRYVAVVGPNAEIVAQAGTASGSQASGAVPDATGLSLEEVGDRVRMTQRLPPPRRAGTSGSAPGREPGSGPTVVIEFEPLIAARLSSQARSTLLLGALASLMLLGAALVFWRLLEQREAAERELEKQRRLGVLGEMSAVLAHEIRNPLASLKGHAQLLAEALAPEGREQTKANRIVREATRLETLSSDLLDFSRSNPVDRSPVDPVALLRDVAEEIDPDAITIRTASAPGTWPLDAARLRQALANVLRNATQASPDRVEAIVSMAGPSLTFTVRDFGPGIPADRLQRLFEPFYTTRSTGTGLGLAVAQRIMEMHGGTIAAENHPDGGAIFRLAIPKA